MLELLTSMFIEYLISLIESFLSDYFFCILNHCCLQKYMKYELHMHCTLYMWLHALEAHNYFFFFPYQSTKLISFFLNCIVLRGLYCLIFPQVTIENDHEIRSQYIGLMCYITHTWYVHRRRQCV